MGVQQRAISSTSGSVDTLQRSCAMLNVYWNVAVPATCRSPFERICLKVRENIAC